MKRVDTLVIGGGTAGAAVAGLLAQHSDEEIGLLEAGPDYGALEEGRWPRDLLDATALASSHDWGYDSGELLAGRELLYERARVLGGCSAHNGCAEVVGAREDYDAWAAAGNPGWSTDELLPHFAAAERRLRLKRYADEEVTPFQSACIEAADAIGIPRLEDLNDLTTDVGIACAPMNIVDGVRFNTAFAYLDPVRSRPNLEIQGRMLVDRLLLSGGVVVAAEAIDAAGRRQRIEADRFVLSAGAYGTPSVLLRSGIGPAEQLSALGVDVALELPGVGANLQDHATVMLRFAPSERLRRRSSAFAAERAHPEEQAIAKARSSLCREAFDLHIFPCTEHAGEQAWDFQLWVACMENHSRGTIQLTSTDPEAPPRIDHALLTDPAGHDAEVLWEGAELARELAAGEALAGLLDGELDAFVRDDLPTRVGHYWHPAGTAKMGPVEDPQAVVGADGRVHGVANLYVADASIMPVLPRANTNLPTLTIGERLAAQLLGLHAPPRRGADPRALAS
jgi:choline dehydrogenase